jgi:hypothetical protein
LFIRSSGGFVVDGAVRAIIRAACPRFMTSPRRARISRGI